MYHIIFLVAINLHFFLGVFFHFIIGVDTARMKELQEELDKDKSKAVTSDMFMASVRKYTRARKLTPRMLNELIEKIEVHQSEKIDGKTVQRLTIHYNCIGAIEIPDLDKLPENKVSVHTRQGVDVHYAACAS